MIERNENWIIIKPSSEAKYIANFLKEQKIKFKQEIPMVDIPSLKKYRKIDFYLPNLKVYIEYFGLYNKNKQKREEYDLKADEYIRNGIPTIFIYPHELGFLDYAFHTKMIRLLKVRKFNLKKQLPKYLLVRLLNKSRRSNLGWFVITGYFFITFNFVIDLEVSIGRMEQINGVLLGILIGLFIFILIDIRDYYLLEK